MKWIISTFALFTLLLVGGVLWLAYADHEDLAFLEPTLEQYVQELTGREFSINGQFELEVGEYVTLVAENIQLGNEAWASEPMAHIKRLVVTVDYSSLLLGTIIIRELNLQGTTLFLERLEDGRNNWTFGDPAAETSENLFRVVLEQAHLDDTAITYRAPALERPLEVAIVSARQEHRLIDDSLSTHIMGAVNGRSIEVDAVLGTFENLLEGKNVEYDLRGRFGGLAIDSHGIIDDLVDPSMPTFTLSVASPNVDDVTAMLGLPDHGEGSLQLVAQLTPHDDNVELTVQGNLAGLFIDASGRASNLTALRLVEFDVTANGPHLGRFLNLIGIDDVPDEPFQLEGHLRRSDSQLVIHEVVLDVGNATFRLEGIIEGFPGLDAANVHLKVAGPDLSPFSKLLGMPGLLTGPFQLDVTIEQSADGNDVVDALLVTTPLQLQMNGPLGDPPNYVGTRFEVVGSGANLHTVASILARRGPSLMPLVWNDPFSVRATLEVSADGYSITDLRAKVRDASISGNANVTSQQGEFAFEVSLPDLQNMDIPIPGWRPEAVPFVLQTAGAWNTNRWTIDTHISLGDATFDWNGVFDPPPDLSATDFKFSIDIPSLANLGTFDGDRLPEQAFTLEAHFDGTVQSFVMDQLQGSLGGTRFTGSLSAVFDEPNSLVPSANLTQQGEFAVELAVRDPQNLDIPFLRWQPDAVPLDLQAQGAWNSDRLRIDSSRVSLGEATLEWNGVFDPPPDLSATDLQLSIDIPNLANLGIFDDERLPERALRLDAHFDGTAESFLMDELTGSLGGTTFVGGLSVDLSGPRPNIDADLDFAVLDLRDWEEDPEEVVDESATATRVIPDYRLPITQLAAMDGTLDIVASTVRLTDITFTDALIQATLLDGGLTVSELDVSAPRGRLDGTLKVLPTDRGADVHFTFGGKDLGLNLGGDPTDLAQAVIFDVDVDLSGHGATIRELAASLSGRASLESDGGRIRNRGISLYTGFGGELLSALNPMAKEIPYTRITCAKVSFEATDGRFETSPTIVVQTERINLISKGAIDLKTEKIDFTFTSKPRKRLSISASELINPYLRVAGTLGKPRLTMNRRGTAVSATAAVATAGLSILARAAWDRAFRKKDPCE